MRRFSFHLGTLVILVLTVAIGLAALRESDELWESSLFSITLGVLLISILLAIHRTAKQRAYWLGFALFGSAYLALSLIPSIESRLITTKALAYLDSQGPDRSIAYLLRVWDTWWSKPTQNNQSIPSTSIAFSLQGNRANSGYRFVAGDGMFPRGFTGAASGSTMNVIRIVHSILKMMAAIMGGLVSRHLYAKELERSVESIASTSLYS
jgi:hypothetical protein